MFSVDCGLAATALFCRERTGRMENIPDFCGSKDVFRPSSQTKNFQMLWFDVFAWGCVGTPKVTSGIACQGALGDVLILPGTPELCFPFLAAQQHWGGHLHLDSCAGFLVFIAPKNTHQISLKGKSKTGQRIETDFSFLLLSSVSCL